MTTLVRWLLRVVLVVAGLVFAAGLLLALLVLLGLWAMRSMWARLTGRPVAPFVMHIDPRSGFSRVYRARQGMQAGTGSAAAPPTGRNAVADVTDVEPKPPRG